MRCKKHYILTLLLCMLNISFMTAQEAPTLTPEEKLVDNEERIKNLIKRLDHFTDSHDEPISKQDYDSLVNLVGIYKLQTDILQLEVDILKNHNGDLNAADSSELERLNALTDQLNNTTTNNNTLSANNTASSEEDYYTTTEITQITTTTHKGNSAQFKKELEEIKAYQEHMDKKLDKLYLALEALGSNPNLSTNRNTGELKAYNPESRQVTTTAFGLDENTTFLGSSDEIIRNPGDITGYAFIVIEAQNAEYKIKAAHAQAKQAGISTRIVLNHQKTWYYLVLPNKYSDSDSQIALKEIRASRLDAWRYIY